MGVSKNLIWARNRQTNPVRSALREYYGAALEAVLRNEHLTAPAPVTAAFAATTRAAVGIMAELNRQIADIEATLAEHFEARPDADIYRSLPGLGVVLCARVLGEFGDDPKSLYDRQVSQKPRRNITPDRRLRGYARIHPIGGPEGPGPSDADASDSCPLSLNGVPCNIPTH